MTKRETSPAQVRAQKKYDERRRPVRIEFETPEERDLVLKMIGPRARGVILVRAARRRAVVDEAEVE